MPHHPCTGARGATSHGTCIAVHLVGAQFQIRSSRGRLGETWRSPTRRPRLLRDAITRTRRCPNEAFGTRGRAKRSRQDDCPSSRTGGDRRARSRVAASTRRVGASSAAPSLLSLFSLSRELRGVVFRARPRARARARWKRRETLPHEQERRCDPYRRRRMRIATTPPMGSGSGSIGGNASTRRSMRGRPSRSARSVRSSSKALS